MSAVLKCQACGTFSPEVPGNSYSVSGLHPMAPSSPALPALPISMEAASAPRVFLLAGKAEHPGILSWSSCGKTPVSLLSPRILLSGGCEKNPQRVTITPVLGPLTSAQAAQLSMDFWGSFVTSLNSLDLQHTRWVLGGEGRDHLAHSGCRMLSTGQIGSHFPGFLSSQHILICHPYTPLSLKVRNCWSAWKTLAVSGFHWQARSFS